MALRKVVSSKYLLLYLCPSSKGWAIGAVSRADAANHPVFYNMRTSARYYTVLYCKSKLACAVVTLSGNNNNGRQSAVGSGKCGGRVSTVVNMAIPS